jgi:hypothetical protein
VSASSFGVGRLLVWEEFAVGLQLGHARVLGQWDPGGTLRWNPPGYSEGISHAQVWAIVRLRERLELQGFVPVLINDRTSGDTRQVAGGLGDAGLAVRWQPIAIGEIHGLPSLALIPGGFAPTGRRIEQTSPPLFAGATGRGSWGASLGVESEIAPSPWFVQLAAGATVFLPFTRPDTGQRERYGTYGRLAISTGAELVPGRWVLALAAIGEWADHLQIDDEDVPDSRSHLYSAALSLAWRLDPHCTLIAVAMSSVWPDGFGANQDARVDLTLGARYGYF